jgi:hypothetical protein
MLRILEQSTNCLVLKKTHQIWLLTILSGIISGCALLLGIARGFNYPLSFLTGIFGLICGGSVLFPAATIYVLDKQSGQLIVTIQCLSFRHTQHHRLREIASVDVGLLENLQGALAQQCKSFSDQNFLCLKFISGKRLLLTTLDPTKPDELQHYQQVTRRIQSFLDI